MSDVSALVGFRRILVALDASRESQVALAAAAGLARQLDAELMGLFIEDIDLLNLAALPFSREIPVLSLSGRDLDLARTERELRFRAAAARRDLAAMADRFHLPWSFRVSRGHVDTELLNAAQEADLIAVGKGARPISARAWLGSTGRAIVTGAAQSVLFAARVDSPADAPVAILYEKGGRSAAIAFAARLAERDRRRLIIFVLGDSESALVQQEISVNRQLRAFSASAAILPMRPSEPTSLWQALQAKSPNLLILDALPKLLPEVTLELLVEKSNCSLLLLRNWELAPSADTPRDGRQTDKP